MKKKILSFICVFIILIFSCMNVFAADEEAAFTCEIPDYVNYSGGAWFEALDSTVGRCTVIFPLEFKDNIFGFSLSSADLPVDIYNFSNTTIYGIVITSNGNQYSCRCSRFSPIEVQTSSTGYNNYEYLNPDVMSLSNSNMLFITDNYNYYNSTVLEIDKFQNVMLSLIAFCSFFSLCVNLFRRGRRL